MTRVIPTDADDAALPDGAPELAVRHGVAHDWIVDLAARVIDAHAFDPRLVRV